MFLRTSPRKKIGSNLNNLDMEEHVPVKKELFGKRSQSTINRGLVTKHAFPSFVGMAPDVEGFTMASTAASLTKKNQRANGRAQQMLQTGDFHITVPR